MENKPSDGNVLPLRGQRIGPLQGARAPYQISRSRKGPEAVDACGIQPSVFGVAERAGQVRYVAQVRFGSSRRLPDTVAGVGPCKDARDCAAWREIVGFSLI